MNLHDGIKKLWELADASMPGDVLMSHVDEVDAEFRRANVNGDSYFVGKVNDVRSSFEELSKQGRGAWTIQEAAQRVHTAIAALARVTSSDGSGFTRDF